MQPRLCFRWFFWAGSQALVNEALKSCLFIHEWTESCWQMLSWSIWSALLISSDEQCFSVVLIFQFFQNLQMSWWGQLHQSSIQVAQFLGGVNASSNILYIYLSSGGLLHYAIWQCFCRDLLNLSDKNSRSLRAFPTSEQVVAAISGSRSNNFVPE